MLVSRWVIKLREPNEYLGDSRKTKYSLRVTSVAGYLNARKFKLKKHVDIFLRRTELQYIAVEQIECEILTPTKWPY